MNLRVIEGGHAVTDIPHQERGRSVKATVQAEAARRLRASGYPQAHTRQLATGAPISAALRYLKSQIDFVADTLGRLDALPEDFREDRYWPEI